MSEHPKEHGLLFKPEMVRAYFAGRKGMTRRVITRQNSYIDGGPAYKRIWNELQFDRAWVDPGPSPAGNAGPYLKVPRVEKKNGKVVDEYVHRVYPRYQVGDTIWGRETFWPIGGFLYNSGKLCRAEIRYKADDSVEWRGCPSEFRANYRNKLRWSPSVFMPRWASRIVTPVVAVRPERLLDIEKPENHEDVFREGLPKHAFMYYDEEDGKDLDTEEALTAFRDLWNSINKDRGYPRNGSLWHGWVWVIGFEPYREGE